MTVAGFQVELTADTEVQGALATGAEVRLTGLTQPPDHILAAKIEGLEPASPPPPTATVEPLVEPVDGNSGSGSSSDDNPESESDDDNSGHGGSDD
jgi:hypothetical protein